MLANLILMNLSCAGGSAPAASAVAAVTCSPRRWPVGGLPLGNHVSAVRPPWHRPSGHVLRKRQGLKPRFSSIQPTVNRHTQTLTMPQGPTARVEEGTLLVVMVTVVGIEVTGNDVLEVSVLPVQITGLDGPCEHSPMGTHLWKRKKRI